MNHLYRSRDDRMLAGVAGGLAELWDADPSLVRIVWALLIVLTGGIALVVYVVMAIVVPEEDDVALPPATARPGAEAMTSGAAAPGATAASSPPDWRSERAFARAQRREAKAARRAERGRDGRTASIVFGGILILAGLGFLVHEYLPSIDFDSIWPFALVAIGIVVVLSALRSGGPTQPPAGSGS